MKKLSIKISIFCFLFLVFSNSQTTLAQYKVGDSVSDFTLQDLNGDSISLFDYRGKVILLNFFSVYG